MKIIILGAGMGRRDAGGKPVGEKNNDITIADTNGDRLRVLQDKFDLRVVCRGHGSYPRVLREAGADDADMLVAVTSSDEVQYGRLSGGLFASSTRLTESPVSAPPDYVRDAENSLTQKRYQSTTLSHQNNWLSIIFIA